MNVYRKSDVVAIQVSVTNFVAKILANTFVISKIQSLASENDFAMEQNYKMLIETLLAFASSINAQSKKEKVLNNIYNALDGIMLMLPVADFIRILDQLTQHQNVAVRRLILVDFLIHLDPI